MNTRRRHGYDDVVVTVPVTIPYVRYSIHGAHWFAARALAGLLEGSGLTKSDIDGLCLGSFTLAPDTAVGLTQHLGLTLRWLDHIPMGGAAGIVALRRALRAVQSGDATVVGPRFLRSHTLTIDGSFPINTSGGQLSVGQAGAAAGFLGLTETVRQLTGESLGAQVPEAQVGLVGGFGMINYDRGLCCGAAILADEAT